MAKLLVVVTLFIKTFTVPFCGCAQPDSIGYIQGTTNRYRVEYYRSTKFISNVNNQLQKLNYRIDTLGLDGVQLRAFRDNLTPYIQQLLPAQAWQGLQKGHGIGVHLSVLGSGQVAEVWSLSMPIGVRLSGPEVEALEGMLKVRRVAITESSRYTRVNFLLLHFPAYPLGR